MTTKTYLIEKASVVDGSNYFEKEFPLNVICFGQICTHNNFEYEK